MHDYVTTCELLARSAGEVLMQWRGRVSVREKGRADLVTEADLASQSLIQQRIAAEFPEHGFLGEEGADRTYPVASEYCWIVDPLDGTTNFVHGLPGWCISIALAHRGRPITGCVYDPLAEACFTATAGGGSFRNGQRLSTSGTESLSDALVAVSLPASVNRNSGEIACFLGLLPEIRAFRRLGSAALNLCYLASGQLDAYWAGSIQPWDVAAGMLIVREAGGVVSSTSGGEFSLQTSDLAVAANPSLHKTFIQKLARAQHWNG